MSGQSAENDVTLDDFEYTLTRRALRQIKAEVWDEAVKSAYLHETEHWMGIKHGPNPYRVLTPARGDE